ncbi:hypothetical protein ATN89_17265 [Comamonas thiooxydans]|nr:hypothetical protein ATN89_17265 [Comamonas thiooxydans]
MATESVGDIFIRRMHDLNLTTQNVAEQLNFSKSNVISMIRSGRMRLPVNRAILAAKELDVDPVYLLRSLAHEIKDNGDDDRLLEILTIALGQEPLTEGEWEMVKMYRKATHKREVVLSRDFPEEFELMNLALEDVSKKVKNGIENFQQRKSTRRKTGPAQGYTRTKQDFDIERRSPVEELTPEEALRRKQAQEAEELKALVEARKQAQGG